MSYIEKSLEPRDQEKKTIMSYDVPGTSSDVHPQNSRRLPETLVMYR
jgi:hypothetical protein